ncbi:MAG: thiamine-phosphate kinase [Gemmatimonadaceae bacterium]
MTSGGWGEERAPATEFEMIAALRARWGDLAVGIGDDAAVLRVARGDRMVVSTDAAVEHVHFRADWLTPREVGYRAVTAALSDLAAMAAAPSGVLVALQLAPRDREALMDIADGIGDAVRAAGTVVLGGNLTAADALGITTTVLGSAYAPLMRGGARAGDVLYVTGRLGGPGAALRALRAGQAPAAAHRERFARPRARIAEARWLATRGATAAIDVSDGLAADAAHLSAASVCAVEIDVETVPVIDGAMRDDALGGGEEYELLVAFRAPPDTAAFAERFGIPLTRVGRVVDGSADVRLLEGGRRVATPAGHDHFRR